MSGAVARILAQIRSLSQEERAELANEILLSLIPEDPDNEEALNKKLARRAERLRSGEAVGIPAEQVFEEWRKRRRP